MSKEDSPGIFRKIKDYFNQIDSKIVTPVKKATTKELDIPQLDSKYVLMYLLSSVGSLNRNQVETLARAIYRDKLEGVVRPIVDICTETGIIDEKNKKMSNDSFLSHVTLDYNLNEMEQDLKVKPLTEDGIGCGLIDVLAGSKAPRPLLMDLYALEGIGVLQTTQTESQEVFVPTHRGKAGSEAIRVTFDHQSFEPSQLVQVGRFGMRVVYSRPNRI